MNRATLFALVAFALLNPRVRLAAADQKAARQELDRQWELLENGKGHGQYGGGQGIRGIFRFVLEGAAVGYDPGRLDQALKVADRVQDRDPASPTYGNLKWDITAPAVLDRNAVEFCMQQAVIIHQLYRQNLSPEGRSRLERIMGLSIEGMRLHRVPVAYTNMALMKAENQILVGEALGVEACTDRGYSELDAWVAFTRRNGVGEYVSPNYYNPDLDSLALVAKFAQRDAGRAQATAALRYFWTDIAANWFQPGERLGGAHSRNYDYLMGRGELDGHLARAGWLSFVPESGPAGWLDGPRAHLTAMADACDWRPPADLTEPIRTQLPRVVVQRWGEAAADRAVNYVGREFALASTGASHGDDDHELTIYWPGGHRTVQSDFFFDGRGDPYGNRPRMGKDGHAKALHLLPLIASAQRGPEVLQLFTDMPYGPGSKNHPGDLSELNAQLVLPAAVAVWQAGAEVTAGTPEHPGRLSLPGPFFLRMGGIAVGVRLLLAREIHGGAVSHADYVQEKPAAEEKRVTVVLSPTEPFGRGSVVVWMRAAEGLDETDFDRFAEAFAAAPGSARGTAERFEARAAGLGGPLAVAAEPLKPKLAKSTGGEPTPELLSVNGREVGAGIWSAP